MQPNEATDTGLPNRSVRVGVSSGDGQPGHAVQVETPLDELSIAGTIADLDRLDGSRDYATPTVFAREVLRRLGEALSRIEVGASLLKLSVAAADPAAPCQVSLSLELQGHSPASVGARLDGADAEFAKFQAKAEAHAAAVLSDLAGEGLLRVPVASRGDLIARLRHTLLQSNLRIECPHCGSPSLPYFLPHTAEGTVQLQHKDANPTSHAVFGSRVGTTFPNLRLVRITDPSLAEPKG